MKMIKNTMDLFLESKILFEFPVKTHQVSVGKNFKIGDYVTRNVPGVGYGKEGEVIRIEVGTDFSEKEKEFITIIWDNGYVGVHNSNELKKV